MIDKLKQLLEGAPGVQEALSPTFEQAGKCHPNNTIERQTILNTGIGAVLSNFYTEDTNEATVALNIFINDEEYLNNFTSYVLPTLKALSN